MRILLNYNELLLTETTTNHLMQQMLKEGITKNEAIKRISIGFIERKEIDQFNPGHKVTEMTPHHVFKTEVPIIEGMSYGVIETYKAITYEIKPDENGIYGTWELYK